MINKAIKLVLPLLAALLLIFSSGVFAYDYERDTITGSEIAQIEVANPSIPLGQSVTNSDDEYVNKQWALSKIQALGAWQHCFLVSPRILMVMAGFNDEVRIAIEAGCQEIGVTGVGGGRIDVTKAMDKVNYGS